MTKKVSDSKVRANKKWDDENRDRKRYINSRSAANGFVKNRADLQDLFGLRNLIDLEIESKLPKEKILKAYNWFMNTEYTPEQVINMNPDQWQKIVDDSQEYFVIGKNSNGYFKVIHYTDIEPRWDKGENTPKLFGYTFVKDFYFGTSYWIFKKND